MTIANEATPAKNSDSERIGELEKKVKILEVDNRRLTDSEAESKKIIERAFDEAAGKDQLIQKLREENRLLNERILVLELSNQALKDSESKSLKDVSGLQKKLQTTESEMIILQRENKKHLMQMEDLKKVPKPVSGNEGDSRQRIAQLEEEKKRMEGSHTEQIAEMERRYKRKEAMQQMGHHEEIDNLMKEHMLKVEEIRVRHDQMQDMLTELSQKNSRQLKEKDRECKEQLEKLSSSVEGRVAEQRKELEEAVKQLQQELAFERERSSLGQESPSQEAGLLTKELQEKRGLIEQLRKENRQLIAERLQLHKEERPVEAKVSGVEGGEASKQLKLEKEEVKRLKSLNERFAKKIIELESKERLKKEPEKEPAMEKLLADNNDLSMQLAKLQEKMSSLKPENQNGEVNESRERLYRARKKIYDLRTKLEETKEAKEFYEARAKELESQLKSNGIAVDGKQYAQAAPDREKTLSKGGPIELSFGEDDLQIRTIDESQRHSALQNTPYQIPQNQSLADEVGGRNVGIFVYKDRTGRETCLLPEGLTNISMKRTSGSVDVKPVEKHTRTQHTDPLLTKALALNSLNNELRGLNKQYITQGNERSSKTTYAPFVAGQFDYKAVDKYRQPQSDLKQLSDPSTVQTRFN